MGFDHGELNVPLSKRGNIDAEIDRFKSRQEAERRLRAVCKAAALKVDRAEAHALVDKLELAELNRLADRFSLTPAVMRKRLRSDCHWQPRLIIGLLSPAA